MSEPIQAALQQHFGFEAFRPGQKEVVAHLLNGHSTAAVFPTGGGKSLCYQLPAILLPGVTLVVSPLIALMKDQIDALAVKGIAAQRLDSTLDAEAYRGVMGQVRRGELHLLYVAPERFSNERFREAVRSIRISLFAVDEAHCISEWGHNFRPDYLKLAGFAHEFGVERILALTATATERVLDDICRGFDIAPECAVRTGFYRPNLTLLTTPVEENERDSRLLAALHERPPGSTIVYVTLQKTAEVVAQRLQADGFPARAYHAGMKDDARSSVQDWFMGSDRAVVVATIAFGMGIDKADIRFVYHYNLPKSLENYAQEIGRAGRDGEPAICHTLACLDDLNVLENFVYGDTPDAEALRGLIEELFGFEEEFGINLVGLANKHDIRPLVLRTLLTYLELDGYLQSGTPYYADYSFKQLMTSGEILQHFTGERRTFLASLFRQATKARIWYHIDPAAAATALGTDRERIVRALDWLGEKQMLEIKVTGVRHRYRLINKADDTTVLADALHQRVLKREAAEIARLRQVIELVGCDECQTAALAAHFGETLQQPCGHCSWCLDGKAKLHERPDHPIRPALLSEIQALMRKDESVKILQSPRSLARFLCGVSSPGISRAKLVKEPLFGVMADVPFRQVLAWIEESAAALRA